VSGVVVLTYLPVGQGKTQEETSRYFPNKQLVHVVEVVMHVAQLLSQGWQTLSASAYLP
jgi:hypothetical protein